MKKTFFTLLAFLLLVCPLLLTACGSGGQTGVTDAAGVGNVALGKALASALMGGVVPDPLPITPVNTTGPALLSPQNGDTWGGHVVKFQWTPFSVTDPRGVTYHIQVFEMGGTGPIYDITGLTSTSVNLMLFDDNYQWTVSATDADGLVVATYPTWYFQVLNSDTAPPDCSVTWPT